MIQNAHFKVDFGDDCFIPGHLIIRPKKPVKSLNELPPEALQDLGPVLAACQKAVSETVPCERIYLLSFCELDPELHFHIFPRTLALTQAFRKAFPEYSGSINGALFFDWAKKYSQEDSAVYREVCEQVCNRISRAELKTPNC